MLTTPVIEPATRADLPIDTIALARWLIGKILVRQLAEGRMSGRIVETEAYLVGDEASHTFNGRTPRNGSMFGEAGHAYVYRAYGVSWMLNISSEARGIGAGVLIRAAVPIEGIDLMRRHRPRSALRDLARGPGRLAAAFAIDRALDGIDMLAPGPLWLASDREAEGDIGASTRIGLTKAADRPLRFYRRGDAHLSGPRRLNL